MAKRIAGPWRLNDSEVEIIVRDSGELVCVLGDEGKRKARTIIAAPVMLLALEATAAAHRGIRLKNGTAPGWLQFVRAALAMTKERR